MPSHMGFCMCDWYEATGLTDGCARTAKNLATREVCHELRTVRFAFRNRPRGQTGDVWRDNRDKTTFFHRVPCHIRTHDKNKLGFESTYLSPHLPIVEPRPWRIMRDELPSGNPPCKGVICCLTLKNRRRISITHLLVVLYHAIHSLENRWRCK